MAEKRLEEVRQQRLSKRQAVLDAGRVPYPAEARRSHTVSEMLAQLKKLQAEQTPLTLSGRIMAVRSHGGVVFLDLRDASGTVQLQIVKNDMAAEIFARLEYLDAGDFVQAMGVASKTKRGEVTLQVMEFHMLAKSIRPLPSAWFGLKDTEKRYRHRELDLLLNQQARDVLEVRSVVIDWLRRQLQKRGYQEVETPILQPVAGGAMAQPFITHHQALDTTLYLRIAPELYLKRLLVAGYEKVFEIGRNFRNEGIDREHNPEFTMLELYWAYADYEDLMDLTEDLLSALAKEVKSTAPKTKKESPFTASRWKRVRFAELMANALDVDILEQKSVDTYQRLLLERQLEVPATQTYAKLVDELYKEVVRPTLKQPTLVYDYPLELAPLAKQSMADSRVAERFQLIVAGRELVNAYTELNDPVEQRMRFEAQQKLREQGDAEVPEIDEGYLQTMEYGMPPAAGWGLGIDRLVSLLANVPNVRDTLAFPLLKPKTRT